MSSFDEIYERIKFATKARTQVELASMLEIRQSSISDAKRRRSVPAEWFLKLHDKFGLSIDWLRWESGPMLSRDAGSAQGGLDSMIRESGDAPSTASEPGEGRPFGEFPADVVLREEVPPLVVPRSIITPILLMTCDYVDGDALPDFSVREHMALPASLLGDGLLVFYVDTGGMAPTLRRGGCVGVSTRRRHLVSGEVFALLMPHEGVAFRRVVQDSESGLFLLCFDQVGLPSTRLPAQSLQTRVLGQVLWTLQPV